MEEMTFYDAKGKPVAYINDGVHIYLLSGKPVVYVDGASVYSYGGKHLGRFEGGWIRDNQGLCVFFTENASSGPMKPMRGMKPMKGLEGLKPLKGLKGLKEMKPMRPMVSSSWSSLSGIQFFEQ
jgi:hypothetical protein